MQMLQPQLLEKPSPCPYLPGREKRYESFLARDVGTAELAALLASGWRKFGIYFFRPACPDCRQCIPVRIPVAEFAPSRSQRRVLKKNSDLRVRFGPLRFTPRCFDIYRNHSHRRFGDEVDLDSFLFQFYIPSCPGLQTEIYQADELLGVGFLDRCADGLSSVYFCFDTAFGERNPGIFSILREIAHAGDLGLSWYYLGYFVPGCANMAYKDHFRPRQHFDWQQNCWRTATSDPAPLPPGSS